MINYKIKITQDSPRYLPFQKLLWCSQNICLPTVNCIRQAQSGGSIFKVTSTYGHGWLLWSHPTLPIFSPKTSGISNEIKTQFSKAIPSFLIK